MIPARRRQRQPEWPRLQSTRDRRRFSRVYSLSAGAHTDLRRPANKH